jgi:YNFM family putative membrane transporter
MFATMYSTQAILPELSRTFEVSPATAGLSVSVVVAAVALGGWVWGPLSDRTGRPRAIRLASWLLVPPTLGVALAPGFEALLVCRALQGLCMPGLLTVAAPYVAEAFVPRVGSRAMGWYVSSLVAGGLIGRVGVALASAAVGWRLAIGALALLPLAAALAMRGSLVDVPPPERSGSVARNLLNPRLIAVTVAGSALFFTFVGSFTFVTYRLEEPPFGYDTSVTALVFLLWVVGLAGPLVGRLAERAGWRLVAATSIGTAALGLLLTLPARIALVVAGLALVAASMFAGYTATQLGVGEAARRDRGAATALYFTAYYGAGALGAYAPGFVWETFGWNGIVATGLSALAVAATGLLASRALRGSTIRG